jgi:hypothetical protein
MITFSVARTKQVLWIEFGLPISEQTYLRLDEERAAILRREGPMDLIMDFTSASAAVFPSELAHQRALVPSAVPGHRRVYVAPGDLVFGMFRMWGPSIIATQRWTSCDRWMRPLPRLQLKLATLCARRRAPRQPRRCADSAKAGDAGDGTSRQRLRRGYPEATRRLDRRPSKARFAPATIATEWASPSSTIPECPAGVISVRFPSRTAVAM